LIRVSLAWTVIGVLGGGAVYASAPRTFRSSVRFLVTKPAGSGVPIGGETDVERVRQAVRHILDTELLEAFVRELNLYKQDASRMSIEILVDRLQSNIVVDIPPAGAGGLVDAFTLSFEHPDPDTAQRVTQLLSGHFVQPQFSMGAGLRMVADRFQIADQARLPEKPIAPRLEPLLVLGALVGLSVGLLFSLFAAFSRPFDSALWHTGRVA
jgi:uncharacterized protein involved in exopolysaccharide biosynthesis